MAKGIFPRLTNEEIIASLTGWGFPVSLPQLIHPTPDFVESVYFACLQQVSELNQESLREPVQSALDSAQLEDRELYASALASNVMLYHMSRMARASRVEAFNAKDLQQPERDRTSYILSGFINFVKFTEQFCESFVKELRERSATLLVERDHLIQEAEKVEQAIHELRDKIDDDEPKRIQLQDENNGLRAKLFSTKEFQIQAVQEVERLRGEKNTLIKRREALNGEIESLSQAIARTKSRIVQSPERIKKTITTMSHTTMEDKRTVVMNEAKARDLQLKISELLNIEKDVRGCVEQLQTIEREVKSLKQSQKELTEVKDHLDDKHIERNELKMKQERVQKQLANAQEKLERAQKHAEDKKQANQRTIDRLEQEYAEMVLERTDNDRQVEELRSEANGVDEKMSEHLRVSEQELAELLAEYWKLRHETDVFMETLANKLNMRVTAE